MKLRVTTEVDNEMLSLALISGTFEMFQVTATIERASIQLRFDVTAFELLNQESFLNADYKKLVICVKGSDLAKNARTEYKWFDATISVDGSTERVCEICFTKPYRITAAIVNGKIQAILHQEREQVVFESKDDDYLAEFIG